MPRTSVRPSDPLDVPRDAFSAAFAKRALVVNHSLGDHPLLTIDAIADLADRLPPRLVRREHGQLEIGNSRGYTPVGHGPPSESIRHVKENGFRISLREVQQVPEYARLVDECLDLVAPMVANREGGMQRRSGYIFISSPASTTPMHFDAEHSFLLQVRGTKHVSVAAFEQQPRRLARELDRYVDGAPCDFPAMQAIAERYTIETGTGVYLPSYVPHWVETEAGTSISFSIPFYTEYCDRAEGVYRINSWLRRAHLTPRRPGTSPRLDAAKSTVFKSLIRARDVRRRLTE